MSLVIERIRALLFDIDGTLMDTDDHLVAMLTRWLRPLRVLLPGRDAYRTARRLVMGMEDPGNRFLQLLDRLHLDGPLDALNEALYRRGLRRPPVAHPPIPGTIRALQTLRGHFRMAVVSTRDARMVHAFLESNSLLEMFPCVVTGQTLPYTKPHPGPVVWAAEQLGVGVDTCLMVGDTVVDIQAGRAAGAQTVGVLSGFGDGAELRAAGANLLLQAVADLPAALAILA
jgi:phosphoglycolate phosphatase